MIANISKMQHFSTDDGPGIRTTIFMQGCNLHCKWCHNPEAISKDSQFVFLERACANCMLCTFVCEHGAQKTDNSGDRPVHVFDREKCVLCGKCAKSCRSHALAVSGVRKNDEEVFEYIRQDLEFYKNTNGGVTFSGGEPLLQHEFVASVAKKCKEAGISVIIDTAGSIPFSYFESVIPYTDMFLFDLKAANSDDYKNWTGGNFALIKENLAKLIALHVNVRICIPVIPGLNDSEIYGREFAKVLEEAGFEGTVSLLPYHRLGAVKYAAIGEKYTLGDISETGDMGCSIIADILKDKYKILIGER